MDGRNVETTTSMTWSTIQHSLLLPKTSPFIIRTTHGIHALLVITAIYGGKTASIPTLDNKVLPVPLKCLVKLIKNQRTPFRHLITNIRPIHPIHQTQLIRRMRIPKMLFQHQQTIITIPHLILRLSDLCRPSLIQVCQPIKILTWVLICLTAEGSFGRKTPRIPSP